MEIAIKKYQVDVIKTTFLLRYKGKYTRKERSRISLIIGDFERSINDLRQDGYDYVCNRCLEGIKIKEELLNYCKMCSSKNYSSDKFCQECGTGLNVNDVEKRDSRHIPKEIVGQVWLRYKGKCVQCGSSVNLQLDHIIPYSKGGATSLDNLQLLCKTCNLEKSNKI